MPSYEYKVVPFIGKVKQGGSAEEVSRQLQSLISTNATDGWEMYQLEEVNIEVSPGCIAGLFGAKESYEKFDQVIFRRER
jgi:hypothetical protein